MNYSFVLIMILIILSSCSNEKTIDESEYNICLVNEIKENSDKEEVEYFMSFENWAIVRRNISFDFKNFHVKGHPFYVMNAKYLYSKEKEDHFFSSSDLEILFYRDKYGLPYHEHYPINTLISIKRIDSALFKSFFITWQNRRDSIFKFENPENHVDTIKIDWEIGEKTDTLFSNLKFETIKRLYPKFNGYFKQIETDTIFVDYSNYMEDREFFNQIKANNFDFGTYFNYWSKYHWVYRRNIVKKSKLQ